MFYFSDSLFVRPTDFYTLVFSILYIDKSADPLRKYIKNIQNVWAHG